MAMITLHVPISWNTLDSMHKHLSEWESETSFEDLAARVIANCFNANNSVLPINPITSEQDEVCTVCGNLETECKCIHQTDDIEDTPISPVEKTDEHHSCEDYKELVPSVAENDESLTDPSESSIPAKTLSDEQLEILAFFSSDGVEESPLSTETPEPPSSGSPPIPQPPTVEGGSPSPDMEMSIDCPWATLGEVAKKHNIDLETALQRIIEFHPSWIKGD